MTCCDTRHLTTRILRGLRRARSCVCAAAAGAGAPAA